MWIIICDTQTHTQWRLGSQPASQSVVHNSVDNVKWNMKIKICLEINTEIPVP